MKRVISGIKPTGDVHIGNYLGAMKSWVGFQSSNTQALYFVADLHGLNTRQDPSQLRSRTFDLVAWLLTIGIDPEKSILFLQSGVSAHAELCWILNNYTTVGELNRMTQYKDKLQKSSSTDGQIVGLYDYPVLMAADILLYDVEDVPVGEDQTQHVELTRKIAERFNNLYGGVFTLPQAVHTSEGKRIMSLQDPTQKMSKSESDNSYVLLLDKKISIIDKFKRAVTDSDNRIYFDKQHKPAITNLLEIYSGFSDLPIKEIEAVYVNKGYGEFKQDLGQLVAEKLEGLQQTFIKYRDNEKELLRILAQGNEKANIIAKDKLQEVRNIIGLL